MIQIVCFASLQSIMLFSETENFNFPDPVKLLLLLSGSNLGLTSDPKKYVLRGNTRREDINHLNTAHIKVYVTK